MNSVENGVFKSKAPKAPPMKIKLLRYTEEMKEALNKAGNAGSIEAVKDAIRTLEYFLSRAKGDLAKRTGNDVFSRKTIDETIELSMGEFRKMFMQDEVRSGDKT